MVHVIYVTQKVKPKMKTHYKIAFILTAILFTLGCNNSSIPNTNTITVSILPQKNIVETLIQDSINVEVMITKGNNPATYEPTPKQMKAVSQSSLYIKIGHIGFEDAWMERLNNLNPSMKIFDSSKEIELIKGEEHAHGDHVHEGGIDPHVWTSPKTMLKVVENTAEALIYQYPSKQQHIEKNLHLLSEKILLLDSIYETTLQPFAGKKFLIFHPAYTYLARDYNLEQISIENQGKEPSAKWLKEIISIVKDDKINAIFVQQEFDKRSAELISSELNIPIIEVKPLAENWLQESYNLLDNLTKSLN